MIRSFLVAALVAFVAGTAAAQQQFNVGDRVTINATGEPGTVLSATPYPVGSIYDTSVVPITNNSVGQVPTRPEQLQPAPLPPIAPPVVAPLVAPDGPTQA